jgi:asparagine synthase (glutamine-hydrolysing)
VKPLYYYLKEHVFLFCSEIKGILCALPDRPEVNSALIYDFLSVGSLDHTDETFFKGIEKLPAGSYIEVNRDGLRNIKYWDASRAPSSVCSFDDNVSRFRELFLDAIRLQMRSDVQVACCLSGGLDSSAVVSVAATMSPYPIRTYTSRFHDRSMDEWKYASAVNGSKPVKPVPIFAEAKAFWKNLEQLVWDQEEPFCGPSVFAQWNLMQQIHADGIKVVLDGQGADELLCGYAKYFYFSVGDMLRCGDVVGAAGALLDAVMKRGNHIFNIQGARRYLPNLWWLSGHTSHLIQENFASRYRDRVVRDMDGGIRHRQEIDIQKYSLPVLLRYEDKNSMAHSIESRVPFLDHRLVEFALGLPTNHKLNKSVSKHVMRKALAKEMPASVLARTGKLGFGGSYRSWISDLEPELEGWLRKPSRPVDQYVRPTGLRRLFESRDPLLFDSLVLDKWLEKFGYDGACS